MGCGSATESSSLLTGLTAYYAFESLLADSAGGGLTLTNNNSVTQGTGRVGSGAVLVAASSQYFSVPLAALDATGDFTIAIWFNPSSLATQSILFDNSVTSTILLSLATTGRLNTSIFPSGGGTGVNITSGGVSVGAWTLCVCDWNNATKLWTILQDNSLTNSVTASGTFSPAGTWRIGTRANLATYCNGTVDEVGLWSRRLTAGEKTALWNGGAGRTYPFAGA